MRTVRDILESKGSEVWSVGPDDTVFDAVKKMADREVGALVVLDGEKLVGIVSERDYAKGLASGRFKPVDPEVTAIFGVGGFVSVLLACFEAADPDTMIDQAVETLLGVMGVEASEASRLARQPLSVGLTV